MFRSLLKYFTVPRPIEEPAVAAPLAETIPHKLDGWSEAHLEEMPYMYGGGNVAGVIPQVIFPRPNPSPLKPALDNAMKGVVIAAGKLDGADLLQYMTKG